MVLSTETDIDHLLETILTAAKNTTQADGGTLYRVTEERTLRFEIMRTDSSDIAMAGSAGPAVPFAPLPLYDENGNPIYSNVVAYAYHRDTSRNIADAYTEEGFDFSGTREFDRKTGYRSTSFLTVPMKKHENAIIGVLQLLSARHRVTGEVVPFSDEDQKLADSPTSQEAVALTNRLLINRLEDLFESFISTVNGAIDQKSPYTGGHCDRVPLLTMMLADARDDCEEGPLSDFAMTEEDRHELKIAELLHDCGKITTPVHVVDKATKLETIYDRVNTIDTRFELLRRDAEIGMLRAKLERLETNHAGSEDDAECGFELRVAEIEKDREFLRFSNVGGEFMEPEDVERVPDISSKYRWKDVDGRHSDFLTDDELENLTIRSGTLTDDKRTAINYHIDVTNQMLEALPWPKHLRNVAEYAGGHHEHMDGTGYPKGLTREQISVQARCMGIADVFEALTAKDRPYKKGKTLSESLEILGKLKLNGHINPDLFDVFMWGKVYLRYAHEFLDSYQIDEVDLSKVPGYVPPPAA
jgi:HD-GYP domain-containing protein (c-di-GMP phosphodiesterase class II)